MIPGRWRRFGAVGLLGASVQLVALGWLNHAWPGHYLAAAGLALELTLLHNFLWHAGYTWRDRSLPASRLRQCLHFHLGNGLVSLFGNLALLHWLVGVGHLPLLLANLLALPCCAGINFYFGNRWVFRDNPTPGDAVPPSTRPV